jgi:hypothetical protein
MKLTNQDLDIIRQLIQEKINMIDRGPDTETNEETYIYINILKKLDRMYFL